MKSILTLLLLTITYISFNQDSKAVDGPYTIELEQVLIPGAPRLHSFAFAQSNGKWLFIGGRNNGLHGFTFGTSFPPRFQNKFAWVVDQNTNQVWSANLFQYLPINVADPLRSTNMQSYQDGDKLFMIGGYGLDSTKDSLVTFKTITCIDVNSMINAVISGSNFSSFVRQINDSRFQACGAEMLKLNNHTYLYGGHNFWGEYTRTVNNQIYNNKVQKFILSDNGVNITISDYTPFTDTVEYHRRDLNICPAVRSNGSFGLTVYGGVFKHGVDLPYVNPVYIEDNSITVDYTFQQKMSQYTCPFIVLFDSVTRDNHTTFIGGESLYYWDEVSNQQLRDTLVPFIDDVTTLTRRMDGSSVEYIHTASRLTNLLGTNAEFIINPSVPRYSNDVIKLQSLSGRTLVGWMYGGIQATFPNLGASVATDKVFKIFITKNPIGIHQIGNEVPSSFNLAQNYPNPFNPSTKITFALPSTEFVVLKIYNTLGSEVAALINQKLTAGRYETEWVASNIPSGVYFYSFSAIDESYGTKGFHQTKKMIILK